MGLLNSKDWGDAMRRTVAKGTKRCTIKEVRDQAGKPTEDGKPVKDTTFISLQLVEPAKTTDGDEIAPGAVIDIGLQTCSDTGGDEKLATMNRLSQERFRQLIVAAFKLPANSKEGPTVLEKNGGASSLVGRQVIADFSPSKQGMNNVDQFSAVPAA